MIACMDACMHIHETTSDAAPGILISLSATRTNFHYHLRSVIFQLYVSILSVGILLYIFFWGRANNFIYLYYLFISTFVHTTNESITEDLVNYGMHIEYLCETGVSERANIIHHEDQAIGAIMTILLQVTEIKICIYNV